MNALQLAEIQAFETEELTMWIRHETATMLRQQADRIRNLEKTLGFKNSGYETINLTPPVAWISVLGIDHIGQKFTDVRVSLTKTDVADIPLYTHPAETITLAELRKTELYRTEQTRSLREFLEPKALTDEEILDLCPPNHSDMMNEAYTIDFARAILRKAQE